jgi:hypothetical protein
MRSSEPLVKYLNFHSRTLPGVSNALQENEKRPRMLCRRLYFDLLYKRHEDAVESLIKRLIQVRNAASEEAVAKVYLHRRFLQRCKISAA